MLRITAIQNDSETILKLEGKLLEPWIEELRGAYTLAKSRSEQVVFNLADLTYADEAGTRLLCSFVQRGVPLGECSPFVTELLRTPQANPE
jgi:anti-anti-sigma regulatory factor